MLVFIVAFQQKLTLMSSSSAQKPLVVGNWSYWIRWSMICCSLLMISPLYFLHFSTGYHLSNNCWPQWSFGACGRTVTKSYGKIQILQSPSLCKERRIHSMSGDVCNNKSTGASKRTQPLNGPNRPTQSWNAMSIVRSSIIIQLQGMVSVFVIPPEALFRVCRTILIMHFHQLKLKLGVCMRP